ncbi:MAG: hypothetical protein JWN67_4681, partial [Actinomycetia bacterium]|nr:hypothetical protein [Actinomycetes bacterium]
MSESMTADDTRRTAATWVAGTGAFLLLVAATVFTAVRWDDLPPIAKLGILLGGTAAFLSGGRALRRTLPGTGAAVLHLGTLLLPVDAVAIGLHLDLGWAGTLFVAGLAGAVAFPLVERTLDSVVLRWAGTGAAAATVAGLAGASPLPAGP